MKSYLLYLFLVYKLQFKSYLSCTDINNGIFEVHMAQNKYFFTTLYDCIRKHFQVENMQINHENILLNSLFHLWYVQTYCW